MPGANGETAPQPESLPTPDAATSGEAVPQSYEQGYNGGYSNGSNCNCSSPYPSTDGYYGSDPGCTNGSCGDQDYGVGGYMDDCGGGTQWFGGVYGLLMTRDNPDFRRHTFSSIRPGGGYPYYPTADVTVLSIPNAEHDYRAGFEVRFGSTFGTAAGATPAAIRYGYGGYDSSYGYGSGCDTCDNNCCQTQNYAWEIGYWFLDDDVNTAQVVDAIPTDTNRYVRHEEFCRPAIQQPTRQRLLRL